MNHPVSTPANWKTAADSDRRLKIEALSWGPSSVTATVPLSRCACRQDAQGFSWPRDQVAYLIPWFNGGAPWQREYLQAHLVNPGAIHFWALDPCRLLERRSLPRPKRESRLFGK